MENTARALQVVELTHGFTPPFVSGEEPQFGARFSQDSIRFETWFGIFFKLRLDKGGRGGGLLCEGEPCFGIRFEPRFCMKAEL